MAYPSVYPTGTTIYYSEKCFNGYTIFPARDVGAALIDMNGNVVKLWKGVHGFPAKILPGGYLLGSSGFRNPKHGFQDALDLIQVNWDGDVVWRFNKYERVRDPRKKPTWMARQHHDYQREGNPVGYYVPGMDPLAGGGNTLLLCHKNLKNPKISDKPLLDDTIIEVTWEGKVIWEWVCSDHFDELGFSEEARNAMHRDPTMRPAGGGMGDWMHTNSISAIGPNRLHDGGDERFHPDNIIWDGRQTNIIAITDKKTGKIVWQIGPDYAASSTLRKLGWIIGQHHAHMIPRGLPGEGNILVFDNGGWAGYGAPNPGSPTGVNNALRDNSRVLEFDPVTLEIVWQYTSREAGFAPRVEAYKFYSGFISSAQRLPNGNTLITEGTDGRLFEVTREHEIVWEYISPYFGKRKNHNMVYRAYRLPYAWVPQLDNPEEIPVPRLDNSKFRVTGVAGRKAVNVTTITHGGRVKPDPQLCVVPE
jgi:hypothetical protein